MGNLCESASKTEQSTASSVALKKNKQKEPSVQTEEEQPAPQIEQQPIQEASKPDVVKQVKTVGLQDFNIIGTLGQGAFGKVHKVRKTDNQKIYAMKQIPKKKILEHKLQDNMVLERNVLKQSKHPFIVQLKYSFQTPQKLYFVMEYVAGGEFYKILQQTKGLPEYVVKYVSAEVVLALEYLNTSLKVIYRDLKPENILLTTTGHVKLTDFGLATMKKENEKTYTLAGTPEYLAPEIITRQGHNFEVDLWTLGVLVYEMIAGTPPFSNQDRNISKIQDLILKNNPQFPPSMSNEAKDLIRKLLKTNPQERLGAKSYKEIKDHPFFEKIKWDDLYDLKMKSPLQEFAEEYSKKQNDKIVKEKPMRESPQTYGHAHKFDGITYNPDIEDFQK